MACTRVSTPLSATIGPIPRRAGDKLQLRPPVDGERREVAGIDADRVRPERDGAGELLGVVRLHERVHPQVLRASLQTAYRRVVEIAKQQQDGICARRAERDQVVLRREEPLGEQGHAGSHTRRSQVGDAAAEALVHEHRDGSRAGALERRRQLPGIRIEPEVACRRRSPLDLGDPGESALGKCFAQASHQRVTSAREKSTRLSSRLAALPESIAAVASASPSARSAA